MENFLGNEDGDSHPNVGELFYFHPVEGIFWSCSGALIAPTWFLTAGHAARGYLELVERLARRFGLAERPLVHFSPALAADGDHPVYETDGAFPHPGFVPAEPSRGLLGRNDVGLVHLAEPVTGVPPMALPDPWAASAIPWEASLEIVGYGLDAWHRGGVTPGGSGHDVRRVLTVSRVEADPGSPDLATAFLRVRHPAPPGADLFGDVGSAVLFEERLVGIVPGGVGNHSGAERHVFRSDLPDVLAWIGARLGSP